MDQDGAAGARAGLDVSAGGQDRDPLSGCDALMAAAQAGDKAAYAALLTRCEAWLRTYLGRRLAPQLVEDVSQEVLLALHLKRHTYDPRRPFAPWFVGVARYKWADRVRVIYREPGRGELTEETGSTASHEGAVLSGLVVERLLSALPEAQAAVIRLVKIEGLSVREAAERTGRTEAWVKVAVHRGRKAMMKRLEAAGD